MLLVYCVSGRFKNSCHIELIYSLNWMSPNNPQSIIDECELWNLLYSNNSKYQESIHRYVCMYFIKF